MNTKVNCDYFEIMGSDNRTLNMDVHHINSGNLQPIVIFAHGYKGFKDYGVWSLIGDEFARKGIVFVRFNFSHNGVTPQTPVDFSDLEAFGQNNFSKELFDYSEVIDFIYNKASVNPTWDQNNISIIGHSRGGGMSILTAGEQSKVKKLITWAAIESTGMRMPHGEQLEGWKKNGVAYIKNARTNQDMPHYFQFYEDFDKDRDRFDIKKAIENLEIPVLIVHGDNDETVHLNAAKLLHQWADKSQLKIINGADHSFGSKHPWETNDLPEAMIETVNKTIDFILHND
jgi:pimeloyl-ACP methyl ester carboxylesterase